MGVQELAARTGRSGDWPGVNGEAESQFVSIRASFIISGDSSAPASRAPRTITLAAWEHRSYSQRYWKSSSWKLDIFFEVVVEGR